MFKWTFRTVDEVHVERTRRLAGEKVVSILAASMLVVGLAASLFGALTWRTYVHDSTTGSFASTAAVADAALGNALQRDAELTSTARTLVETSPGLTNAQLARWFSTLGSGTKFPGAFGLLYVERVPRSDIGAFASRALSDPPFGLHLVDRFTVAPSRSYCFTRYGVAAGLPGGTSVTDAPLAKLLAFAAPDVNFCALPIVSLLDNSERSRRTEVESLSNLLARAPRNGGPQPGEMPAFLADAGFAATVTPVVDRTGTASSARTTVSGWLLGIFDADDILDPLVGHHDSVSLSFENPLGGIAHLDRAGRAPGPTMSRIFHLDVDGHWIARFTAPVALSGLSANGQSLVVLLTGLALSGLLYFLVRVLAGSRAQALSLAEARGGELRHQALHDTLTALPNRALIFDRTEQALVRARHDGHFVAVLLCDLDEFKDINDTFGHVVGDELLQAVGSRFRATVADMHTVGRLGGDEFVVLIESTDPGDGEFLAGRLIEQLRIPFQLASGSQPRLSITMSIGIARSNSSSSEELLREADIALYEAKSSGRNRFVVFEASMHDALQSRLALEFDLRNALARNEFLVHYQPIFELESAKVTSVEALLRWNHPSRGVIGPSEFIPLLESSEAIVEVGRFVLNEACEQVAAWNSAGFDLRASVNVSARQLESNGLVDFVLDALSRSGLEAGRLVLEITETALMSDTEHALVELGALKSIGVQIAVDDFGTGYSSLAYLERFPVDSIKIDRSFIAGMDSSREGRTLVHTLVQLGKALGLTTLAEGIEDSSQLARLRAEDCDLGQGFLLARPLDPASLVGLLGRTAVRTSASSSA